MGGDPITTYDTWDDPPSSHHLAARGRFRIPNLITYIVGSTNIAGWKIHHFDGIYQEKIGGFSMAMLVY